MRQNQKTAYSLYTQIQESGGGVGVGESDTQHPNTTENTIDYQ